MVDDVIDNAPLTKQANGNNKYQNSRDSVAVGIVFTIIIPIHARFQLVIHLLHFLCVFRPFSFCFGLMLRLIKR